MHMWCLCSEHPKPDQSTRLLAHDLQASASGQPDIDFAEEPLTGGDLARPDVRCLIRAIAAEAVEAKHGEVPASVTDRQGIDSNRGAFGKVRLQD